MIVRRIAFPSHFIRNQSLNLASNQNDDRDTVEIYESALKNIYSNQN